MGLEVRIDGLTNSFDRRPVFTDVTFTVPAGEISALVGPAGAGKTLLLRTLLGLARPDRGSVIVGGRNLSLLPGRALLRARTGFGVVFAGGGLFAAMSLFENVAFPLREHTRHTERQVAAIVREKLELVGALYAQDELPELVSASVRKRAALARALVLGPHVMLIDEPEAGLDPVRAAHLNQLIVDLCRHTGATFLLTTHDIAAARTVPDNIGVLYDQRLVMFGPREMLLSSHEPVVRQFLTAESHGPIGPTDALAVSTALVAEPLPPIPAQLTPSDGRPRPGQRRPGEWLLSHGIPAPPGSFGPDRVPRLAAAPDPIMDAPTVELPRLGRNPRELARERAAARAALRHAAGDFKRAAGEGEWR